MILIIIYLAIIALLSTFQFYLYLLSVAVSWIQGKKLGEEFVLNVPSMFVTMIGSGVMLLTFNVLLLVSMILISVDLEFILINLYNITVLMVQITLGYIHYKRFEKRNGPVGRSIIHQFLLPNWKPENNIGPITNNCR